MHTILAAIDFSNVTDDIIAETRRCAEAFKSRVYLLHVEAPEPDFVGYDAGPQSVRDNVAKAVTADMKALRDLADELENDGITVEPLVIQGPTIDKIVEETKSVNADLLIIGSHGHGRLHTLLYGSTADGIVAHPPCPVLVVPDKGE